MVSVRMKKRPSKRFLKQLADLNREVTFGNSVISGWQNVEVERGQSMFIDGRVLYH